MMSRERRFRRDMRRVRKAARRRGRRTRAQARREQHYGGFSFEEFVSFTSGLCVGIVFLILTMMIQSAQYEARVTELVTMWEADLTECGMSVFDGFTERRQ